MLWHHIVWVLVSMGNVAVMLACGVCILGGVFYVPRHGYVESLRDVIPFQFNAAVQIARPVHCDAIFFFDAVDEVSGMFFSNIFHPNIIDN